MRIFAAFEFTGTCALRVNEIHITLSALCITTAEKQVLPTFQSGQFNRTNVAPQKSGGRSSIVGQWVET
jgi:hypothetical protein